MGNQKQSMLKQKLQKEAEIQSEQHNQILKQLIVKFESSEQGVEEQKNER